MKRIILAVLAFALIGLNISPATAQRNRRSKHSVGGQNWSSNYRESLAIARRLDKPLMVVFRCIP